MQSSSSGERTPSPQTSEYLRSLTPLRGVAALWVVLYHYTVVYFPNLHPERYTHVVGKGYLAVDLFFILSGFVITHVYHDKLANNPSKFFWRFLFARIARLYPLHIAVLLLFVATAVAAHAMEYASTGTFAMIPLQGARSFVAFIANIFMLQGIEAGKLSWNYPAWSISVEFIAYLGFPFLLPILWHSGLSAKLSVSAFLLLILALLAYLTNDDFNQWDGPQTLLRCLPEFILGTLLYGAFRSGRCSSWLGQDISVLAVVAVTVALLHFGAPDFMIVCLFIALVLAAVSNQGRTVRALNVRPLVWLGDISYSLYLIHGFVQYVTTEALVGNAIKASELSASHSLLLAALMISVSLLLGTFSYYAIEKSGRQYLRAFFGLRRRPVAAARGSQAADAARATNSTEPVPARSATRAEVMRSRRPG